MYYISSTPCTIYRVKDWEQGQQVYALKLDYTVLLFKS